MTGSIPSFIFVIGVFWIPVKVSTFRVIRRAKTLRLRENDGESRREDELQRNRAVVRKSRSTEIETVSSRAGPSACMENYPLRNFSSDFKAYSIFPLPTLECRLRVFGRSRFGFRARSQPF